MAPDLSFEEKVDYIYKELKSQKRSRFLNFFFKISILIILAYWAFNITKWLTNEAIIAKISSNLWTIVKPIVHDLIKETSLSGTTNNNY